MSLVLNCFYQQGYRSVTGVTKSVSGVTKSAAGVTKSVTGVTKSVTGVTKSVTGVTKVSLHCYQLHKHMINLGLLFCWCCSIGHR